MAQFFQVKVQFKVEDDKGKVKKQNVNFHLVLSGGNKGNLEYLLSIISQFELNDSVHILGLVPSIHMKALYQGSIAVVMPTYFGPTNLPPLEAWTLGVPLIYSNHLVNQTEKAALTIDPDDSVSIANAMQKICDIDLRNKLINEGFLKINEINKKRNEAVHILTNKLMNYAIRIKCWKN